MPKRVVIKEPLLTFLYMLDEATDETELIDNLVNFGLGNPIRLESMPDKVQIAFEYLTSDKVIDSIYIDSKD